MSGLKYLTVEDALKLNQRNSFSDSEDTKQIDPIDECKCKKSEFCVKRKVKRMSERSYWFTSLITEYFHLFSYFSISRNSRAH